MAIIKKRTYRKSVKGEKVFPTPGDMEKAWAQYKKRCDEHKITVTMFSAKNSEFVTQRVLKRITYTIKGFCSYNQLSAPSFYQNYLHCRGCKKGGPSPYAPVIQRIQQECETDAREKFETGELPPMLAGLWMGGFGYSNKVENNLTSGRDKAKDKLDRILDNLGEREDT